jgi:hypothetical protein
MQRRHVRASGALLIAFGAFCTLALAFPRGASAEHACCQSQPSEVATQPSPCQGLLPLSCCEGSAIPSASDASSDSGAPPALAPAIPAALGATALAPAAARSPAPPGSALLRTVVLRL